MGIFGVWVLSANDLGGGTRSGGAAAGVRRSLNPHTLAEITCESGAKGMLECFVSAQRIAEAEGHHEAAS